MEDDIQSLKCKSVDVPKTILLLATPSFFLSLFLKITLGLKIEDVKVGMLNINFWPAPGLGYREVGKAFTHMGNLTLSS